MWFQNVLTGCGGVDSQVLDKNYNPNTASRWFSIFSSSAENWTSTSSVLSLMYLFPIKPSLLL